MLRPLLLCAFVTFVCGDYWLTRQKFIENERSRALGWDIKLNPKEKQFNEMLMKVKYEELDAGFKDPESFPPAMHFFKAKASIEGSKLFEYIKKIPKGGALHCHDFGMVHMDYVIKNVTYRDHLHMCDNNGTVKFGFFEPPVSEDCYKSVKVLRSQARSPEDFDDWLYSKLTVIVDDPYSVYPDGDAVWQKFQGIFEALVPLLTYKPVFQDYYYKSLQEFYEDNVKYIELRGTLPIVYELTGWPMNPIQVLGFMRDITEQFKRDYKDFIGVKFIYAPPRKVDNDTVKDYVAIYKIMKDMYPDFLIGFDLVGQEDAGYSLKDFVDYLQGEEIKYFFHAGETNWNGMSVDENLIDALLLNTTRIGHGYALTKHLGVLEEVMRRGIAIEVNPISNQVLNLVKDLRNHPANVFFADNLPMVISSDDPALWGAKGLSYDFYEAFLGMTHRDADLRTLKKLAMNSFQYSALSEEGKQDALQMWQKDWDRFLTRAIMDSTEVVSGDL